MYGSILYCLRLVMRPVGSMLLLTPSWSATQPSRLKVLGSLVLGSLIGSLGPLFLGPGVMVEWAPPVPSYQ